MRVVALFVIFAATASAAVLPRSEDVPRPIPAGFAATDDASDIDVMSMTPVERIELSPEDLRSVSAFTISSGVISAPPFDPSLANTTSLPPSKMSLPDSTLEGRGIIDGESRRLETNSDFPWNMMGRLQLFVNGGQSWCSAAQVGEKLVLTARHCVQDVQSFNYQPAYHNEDRLGSFAVTRVLALAEPRSGRCATADDWAILVLDRAPGGGYLGVGAFTDDMSNGRDSMGWKNYGYPLDKSGTGQLPFTQDNFNVFKQDCLLLGDADAIGGQSGGPLWKSEADGQFLYGLLVAESSQMSFFSFGEDMVRAVAGCREEYK